ncbi:hypothetical protein E2562_013181 [Oryza meyeriana var. granulata]|uniref:Retrotransposon gag domain-containing protein n=1 Tax=Oryza meyeriana var. granulata TaxID=110450 RepID=A0A6G1DI01_9ORYZ|nr:hypothetical protein E2562_013181 [Oryza meyeriana var. granulata]
MSNNGPGHLSPDDLAAALQAARSQRPATDETNAAEPTMAQILAMQNRLFERMLTNSENLSATLTHTTSQGQSKLTNVQRLSPPSFSTAIDPVDADDWLRDIEVKLDLARCDEREKAEYATYYLQGVAAAWWESYKTIIPSDEPITWVVFKQDFRSAHIPAGLMEIKRKEFLSLKQEGMPFMDFLNRFNYLSRYATEEMPIEARRVKLCRDRLNPELKHALSAHEINSMKSLVDKVL